MDTDVIVKATPAAGSVGLGYGWTVVKLSLEQVKTNPPVVIPRVLLTVNPWLGIVNVKTPDVEAYPALVAVCVPPVLSVIEEVP